ncbi:Rrf2 family transcriptional regulator [Roseospira marina]|uniref:Rrf2 family transcriptional regulator n=1 Tax=Roseospira marina TaxID=140057 RepID=A0A5M6IEC5_9PROT|nr:Rrf2 family transcriptional regulator [Roseospira marina]KAA5606630.1 Rrf2 family transcriptional regulator [Roseospira marina]MBB4313965.1 Rrf2 family protein [Roseospira marina]MBB5087127.1 Rrf2 family protein [Roseospira marina]
MIRIPRRHLAAIEAVLDIAYHGGPVPVRGAEIADRLGLPRRYLEQSLQTLARAGILLAQRGPRGGYRLARERRRITVGEIVRALEGEDDAPRDDRPVNGQSQNTISALGKAVVIPMARTAEQALQDHLDALTIEDLCRRGREQGVPGARDEALDFTI